MLRTCLMWRKRLAFISKENVKEVDFSLEYVDRYGMIVDSSIKVLHGRAIKIMER